MRHSKFDTLVIVLHLTDIHMNRFNSTAGHYSAYPTSVFSLVPNILFSF